MLQVPKFLDISLRDCPQKISITAKDHKVLLAFLEQEKEDEKERLLLTHQEGNKEGED